MYFRKSYFVGLVLFAVALVGVFRMCDRSHRGPVIEQWQTENKRFRVRVTAYEERGTNVNGAYYVFEAAPAGSDQWREIITFRHDDNPKIPTDQVRYVNHDIGYVFMGWMYAVTTDAGSTWSVWSAEKDLPNWQCCNYKLISNVTLGSDGGGTMKLNAIEGRRGELPELRTNDYGRHWIQP
jgi:hypothetical protein